MVNNIIAKLIKVFYTCPAHDWTGEYNFSVGDIVIPYMNPEDEIEPDIDYRAHVNVERCPVCLEKHTIYLEQ